MGFIDTFFGGGQESAGEDYARMAEEARQYEEKQINRGIDFLNPYMLNANSISAPYLQSLLGQLRNPAGLINSITSGYSLSPEAQFQQSQGLKTLQNMQEATGSYGSTAGNRQIVDFSQGVASKDMNNYLQNVLGVRTQGLSGLGGVYNTGFNAATNAGSLLAKLAELAGQSYGMQGEGMAAADIGRARGISGFLGSLTGGFL